MLPEIQDPYLKREEVVVAADNKGALWREITYTFFLEQQKNITVLIRRDGFSTSTSGSVDHKTFCVLRMPDGNFKPLDPDQVTANRLEIISLIDRIFPVSKTLLKGFSHQRELG